MAFWDWEDYRYRQERILLIFSVFGIIAGPAALIWLFSHDAPPAYQPPVEIADSIPTASGPDKANLDALQRDFDAAIEMRDFAAAEEVGLRILEIKPDSENVVVQLGRMARDRGNFDEAMGIYDRAIAVKSTLLPYYIYQKALVLRKMGRSAEAVAEMQRGIAIDPGNVGLNNCLMITQIEAGNIQTVRDELKSYAMLNSDAQKSLWLLGQAALALHDGDFSQARTFISEFQRHVPPAVCDTLLNDPYFDQYRSNPATISYLLVSRLSLPETQDSPTSF